ncbi:sugar phosphate nucleotidyltransferase [Agaribacterium sp. ZY112]|uniref:sugar phosphate nucleotidyltransferase n=1 Tax=Agaribacterium sp. ZY112 TaxID=3233574 RepID=UPI00352455BF
MIKEAIVLVGGKGTRLKSVSGDTPKPLVAVGGTPFLHYILSQLSGAGFNRIVLAAGYRAEDFMGFLEDYQYLGAEIIVSVEKQPLGTGGAIRLASDYLSGDSFLVVNGDTYSDVNLFEFLNYGVSHLPSLSLVGVYVDDASRYGSLTLGEGDRVISMGEKSLRGPAFINSGLYYVSKMLISGWGKGESFSFEKDVLESCDTKIYCYKSKGYFIDIGVPEDYYKANNKFS